VDLTEIRDFIAEDSVDAGSERRNRSNPRYTRSSRSTEVVSSCTRVILVGRSERRLSIAMCT
jgi:hypothetical protein